MQNKDQNCVDKVQKASLLSLLFLWIVVVVEGPAIGEKTRKGLFENSCGYCYFWIRYGPQDLFLDSYGTWGVLQPIYSSEILPHRVCHILSYSRAQNFPQVVTAMGMVRVWRPSLPDAIIILLKVSVVSWAGRIILAIQENFTSNSQNFTDTTESFLDLSLVFWVLMPQELLKLLYFVPNYLFLKYEGGKKISQPPYT